MYVGRPLIMTINFGSYTTNVYKLDAYTVAGSILTCDSVRLWYLIPSDWRWFMQFSSIFKLGKSIYRLYSVKSTINQQLKNVRQVHGYTWNNTIACFCTKLLALWTFIEHPVPYSLEIFHVTIVFLHSTCTVWINGKTQVV